MKTQSDIELKIFSDFAAVCGLNIREGSIVHREPPAPDIACELENGETLGFELTELVDPAFLSRLGSALKLKDYYNELWRKRIAPEVRSEFKRAFGDAIIHIDYIEGTTIRQRKSVAEQLIHALLKLPEGETGKVLKNDLKKVSKPKCLIAI